MSGLRSRHDLANAVPDDFEVVASRFGRKGVRGVDESHPTRVSQGFRRLALPLFRIEPAKSLFASTPYVEEHVV